LTEVKDGFRIEVKDNNSEFAQNPSTFPHSFYATCTKAGERGRIRYFAQNL
jgi:hypothetical protein